MLVFNGQLDIYCNPVGTKWFLHDLGLKPIGRYGKWTIDGFEPAGEAWQYESMTFATVLGAGHLISRDRPKETFALIQAFLRSEGRNVTLTLLPQKRSPDEASPKLAAVRRVASPILDLVERDHSEARIQ